MRSFSCDNCGQLLFFENSLCLRCKTPQTFVPSRLDIVALLGEPDTAGLRGCANSRLAECNWAVEDPEIGPLCRSCAMTQQRPSDGDAEGLAAFAKAETAKRRLLFELYDLGLPVEDDLHFDLLSSRSGPIVTGHDDGLITIDLAEGDDAQREARRAELGEPYRTLLGHFRHEIGHYYFYRLVSPSQDYLARFNQLFGDPDADYQAALDRHYSEGAPRGWKKSFVSSYATMHPAEDWAETFAHYLHVRDTLDTASWTGFAPASATFDRTPVGPSSFQTIIDLWLPLCWSLNMLNRSMGHDDLYPFVLPAAVLEKMAFIHTVIEQLTSDSKGPAAISV